MLFKKAVFISCLFLGPSLALLTQEKVTFLASAATSGQAQFTAARPNKGACSLDNAMEEMNEQPFGVEFLEEITPTDNTTFGANCTCQIVRVSSSVQGEQTRTECICD